MKFCIITDVPIKIPHGLGQYVRNLIRILNIEENSIYNMLEMSENDIQYINSNFEVVSVQMGILKENQLFVIDKLDKITIPKIATIHSVVDEEIKWLTECFSTYFNQSTVKANAIYSKEYLNLLHKINGFIFYTQSDKTIFESYYKLDVPKVIIPPSIQYITDNVYSQKIKKTKRIGYLGRVEYRKGLIASLNSMDFLTDYILNMYGLVMDKYDSIILDHFLNKNNKVNYHGLLSDKHTYFNNTSIFFGNSLYEPFGFSHVENLFNFVVPVIGKGTGTHEVFGWDYPFVVEDSVPQLVEMVNRIEKMDESELVNILKKAQSNLIHLTDEYFREEYLKAIKSII